VRRATAFSLAAAVIVLVLGVLAVIEFRRPTAWQDELTAHLARLDAEESAVRLLAVKRARRSDLFDGHLSRAVWGNQSYTAKPLPYPPDTLYCIQLEYQSGGSSPRRQLLFVALHRDLHNADWILHEGDYEPFSADLTLDLRALGCVSVLDP
jgi:hypothetical protein